MAVLSWLWIELYLPAKLELDPTKLSHRIDEARYTILDRIADQFFDKIIRWGTARAAGCFGSAGFPAPRNEVGTKIVASVPRELASPLCYGFPESLR